MRQKSGSGSCILSGAAILILFFSIFLSTPVTVTAEDFGYIGSNGTPYIVTGPGAGPTNDPLVRVFDPANVETPLDEWLAYGAPRYGANVAVGQLDDDLEPEVITGPGPGSQFGPHVRGFEIDGAPIGGVSFLAYGTNKWGVNVALGDLDMDGYDEIITGAGPGPVFGPHVRGWNWDGMGEPAPIPQVSFQAFGTWKWGVNVACGDIDGDGFDEIVTGSGPGPTFGPHVRGWNWDGLAETTSIDQINFMAYGTMKRGVNVACGDIDGDGMAEIITAPGPGSQLTAHIRGWGWNGVDPVEPIAGVDFIAYDNNYRKMGANIACADVDGDGIDEILTGPGPKPQYDAWVKAFSFDGVEIVALESIDFIAYDPDEFNYGVKVGGTRAR
jgi:hypothetical protein